jgi:glycosyltransferase involved in cell wall biosynthesis
MNQKYSVIIPVLNEISNIELILGRLDQVSKRKNIEFEIIIVDDGSRQSDIDNYPKIKSKFAFLNLKILILGDNFGHQKALEIGIKNAQGDYIITMDGDLQDPPEFLDNLISEIDDNNLDFVGTVRASRKTSLINKFLIFLFYKIISFLVDQDVVANSGDFRIAKKQIYEKIFKQHKPFYFFRFELNKKEFKKKYISYHQKKRINELAKGKFIWYLDFAFQAIVASSNKLSKKALLVSVISLLFFSIFMLIFIILFLIKKVSLLTLILCITLVVISANAFVILLVLDYIIFNYLSSIKTETINFKKI